MGKDQSGLILYANWGSSQTALSNGDWGEDSACKCYVTYYMTEYCLRYCVFLHKYSWLTVVMHTRLRIANASLLGLVYNSPDFWAIRERVFECFALKPEDKTEYYI